MPGKNPKTGEREVPKDEDRKQVLAHRSVREYISEQTQDTGMTYSEQLEAWMPDDPEEDSIPGQDEDIVSLKLTPHIHERIGKLTEDSRLRYSQVVAYYTMMAAIENRDIQRAARFARLTPTTVIREMQEASNE